MSILLTDEEIEVAKAEAERLSWTFRAHPRFEKEKYLLGIQLKKIAEFIGGVFSEKKWETLKREIE